MIFFLVSFFSVLFFKSLSFAEITEKLEPIIVESNHYAVTSTSSIKTSSDSRFGFEIPYETETSSFEKTSSILQNIPGIYIQSAGLNHEMQYIRMRGLSSHQVLVLVDGIPVNSVFDGKFDLSLIPLSSIEKVVVYHHGPARTVSGEHLGGVIDIRTKSNMKQLFSIAAGVGSFNTAFIRSLVQHNLFSWNVSEQLEFYETKGNFSFFHPASNQKVHRINNQTKWAFVKLASSKKKETSELRFSLDGNVNISGQPGFFIPEQNSFASTKNNHQNISMIFKTKTNENLVDHETKLFYQRQEYFYTDPDNDGKPSLPIISQRNEHGVFAQHQLSWMLREWLDISTGLHISNQWVGGIGIAQQSDEFPNRFKISSTTSSSIVVIDSLLTLSPAFCLEKYSDLSFFVSPQIGAAYRLHPRIDLKLKSNFEHFFRPPSFDELYHINQGYMAGNPNLHPETGFLFDSGIEFKTLHFKIITGYFHHWMEEEILYLHQNAFTVRPENVGLSQHEGLELAVSANYQHFNIITSYTFNNSLLKATQKRLPMTPLHQIGSEMNLSLFRRVKWKIQTNYYSQTFGNLAQTLPVSEYIQCNTMIQYQNNNYWFRIDIDNIFNNQQLQTMFKMPLPGRALYATIGASL